MASSTLPEEIVEEILLRVPADEPADMVRAAAVCKAWRRILADDGFLCRYRRFHKTPPLLGFIYNHYVNSVVEFVPTTCLATSTVRMPTFGINGYMHLVLDCRHGHVLILAKQRLSLQEWLIVWDPITGDHHQLMVPSTYTYSPYNKTAAVLCTKDACDHLSCHGGSFLVVLVGTIPDNDSGVHHTRASVYLSETGAWRALTPNDIIDQYVDDKKPSLLIGDALYFPTTFPGYGLVKYDFCKHELSVMELPRKGRPILIKGDDGALGAASILCNCIYMWSWQLNIKGVGAWVKYRVMKLDDTLLPDGVQPRNSICMAEGTNTVFIGIESTGRFMLDLKTKQVSKIGEGKCYFSETIFPYMMFYTPKF